MAASIGMNYNPSAVMMKQPGSTGTPYLGGPRATPVLPTTHPVGKQQPAPSPAPPSGTLGAHAIRATGPLGGYDPAYAQNLATYGGGQFSGVSGFNPFNVNSFPGQPTGGGNAPVLGMPNTLLSEAQGGQPFSWNPSAAKRENASPGTATVNTSLQDWLKQFLTGGLPTMTAS